MEFGFWDGHLFMIKVELTRLNPCYNGIWFLSQGCQRQQSSWYCLNPCYNGIWFLSTIKTDERIFKVES